MPPRKSHDYSFFCSEFTPLLRVGFVEITHADKLPLQSAYYSAKEDEVTFRLSGPDSWAALHLCRLPGGAQEFKRISEWYGTRKNRVRLPEGGSFNSTHLALPDLPPDWLHDGWARARTDIIHTYQTADHGLLTRMVGNKTSLLTNPLLAHLQANIRIRPDAWVLDAPEALPLANFTPPFKDKPLSGKTKAEMVLASERTRALLSLQGDAAPEAVQEAIQQKIDKLRVRRPKLSSEEQDSQAADLGVLWGQSLCDAVGWEWREMEHAEKGKGGDFTGVCSKDRAHMVNPSSLLQNLLKSKSVPNNSLLLFQMIGWGHIPLSRKDGFMGLY